ncbi:hypothetical protein ACN24K_01555 [Streptomyces microflavus]
MPEKPVQHWTDSLVDSVYALYETAREYRMAYRAAEVAAAAVDFDRRVTHEGQITLAARPDVQGRVSTLTPHGQALIVLHRLYNTLETETQGRYEEAALLYASGTAWAIRAVLRGDTPSAAVFQTTDHGDLAPPALEIPGLDTWVDGPALDAAYSAVVRCTEAAEYSEQMADWGPISEHEAGTIVRAETVAAGLADACYAYGLLAQRALNHALIEPRRALERETALARAEAQRTESTAPGDAQA